ncbi:helix-turn-helix domain-containing protein [Methylobrevis pamukkalensis]|uniref:Nitrogen fixation regulation protein FixK n=1 Tax=Methylobrevis pamukkalensis TaxID=1439726 RepID=A0A1E3H872_9HYPH|nr:helix-turn-helix domain-containing protein [Methylobrevis pamukkalensis]ODN72345.1 Nitrogen fixation regulation protein FixK [Methylobrevis pamukkalensis]
MRSAATTRVQSFANHETVFHEDDAADRMFEVVEGSVMLFRLLADGRRQVVDILSAGDLVGISLTGLYDCSAEAIGETRLRILDRRQIDGDAELQLHVNRCLMSRIETLHSHAVLLGRKSAAERVASFLMRFVPGRGVVGCAGPAEGDDSRVVVLRMTRQEIADYLGLTIETVSRVLSDMKRRGVISIEKNDHIRLASICRVCKLTGIH